VAYIPLSPRNVVCVLDPETLASACPFTAEEEAYVGAIRWSPDGTMIAIQQPRDGNGRIVVFSADGSSHLPNGRPSPSLITGTANVGGAPTWASDSQRIAGIREGNIFIASLAGGDPDVIELGEGRVLTATWSPDGANFAFSRVDADGGGIEVAVVDAKTEARRTLHHFADSAAASAILYNISWSPDGQHVVFAYVPGFPEPVSSVQYWVTDVAGDNAKLFYECRIRGAISTEVGFSGDGEFIAFDGYSGKTMNVFVARPDGSDIHQLTHSNRGAFGARPAGDGMVLYNDLDGPPALMSLIKFDIDDPENSTGEPLVPAVEFEWAPVPGTMPPNAVELTPLPTATSTATPRPTGTPVPRPSPTPASLRGPNVGDGKLDSSSSRQAYALLSVVGIVALIGGWAFRRIALRR
jgi:Tol biopolymer transport system component